MARNPEVCRVLGGLFVSACLAGAAAGQSFDPEGNGGPTFYGQLDLAVQGIDDGVETVRSPVDNAHSPSRLGLHLDLPLGGGTLRLTAETALGLRSTTGTGQGGARPAVDWDRGDIRRLEAVASGAGFGTISFGQGSMATDGAALADLSGTEVVGSVAVTDFARSFRFRDGSGALTGIALGDVYNDFDGGRQFRLRYDTPKLRGFGLALAHGRNLLEGDGGTRHSDLAIGWSGTLGEVALQGSLGYALEEPEQGEDGAQVVGSVALRHGPSGLSVALAGGADRSGDGGRYVHAKLGWAGEPILDGGSTAVSVDYFLGEDFLSDGSRSEAIGLQAVQRFLGLRLELYAGYRRYGYEDRSGTDYRDIEGTLIGARWRF